MSLAEELGLSEEEVQKLVRREIALRERKAAQEQQVTDLLGKMVVFHDILGLVISRVDKDDTVTIAHEFYMHADRVMWKRETNAKASAVSVALPDTYVPVDDGAGPAPAAASGSMVSPALLGVVDASMREDAPDASQESSTAASDGGGSARPLDAGDTGEGR